ncbi:MAG: LPXTG cell wall anchor domain-containing protein, partial [candidate division Zixibacteria bacterium]|nr:LPXTG cell wall anchor domain-containing protein [candidate division Zixibacteria bacterium]
HFNIATLFMDTMFFWLGLAMIVIIAAFLRYRKRRKYYKQWEEEEKLHSTDFDYGDPDNPEQIDDDEPWRS